MVVTKEKKSFKKYAQKHLATIVHARRTGAKAKKEKMERIDRKKTREAKAAAKEEREHQEQLDRLKDVDPQFYSFRWITLLFAQEFPLPDTLRIWDMILSDEHGRTDCLLRICTSLVLHVRETLLTGDFSVIMKTLQRYPPVDINVILQRAAAMCPCKDILS